MAAVLELVLNEPRFKGFIYYSLQVDVSTLLITDYLSSIGHKRLSFYEYNTIIEAVIE